MMMLLWIIMGVCGFIVAAGIVCVLALLLKIVDLWDFMDQESGR